MKAFFYLLTSLLVLSACHSPQEEEVLIERNNKLVLEETFHPWYQTKIDSLEMAIYDVAYALKIPYGENTSRFSPNIYPNVTRFEDKSTNHPRQVYLRFMLNREVIDLTYANMILKQELEKAKGRLIDGIFFANWKGYLVGHKLTYRNHDDSYEYIIRLVYDNSPYSEQEKSQEIALILTEIGNNKEIITDNITFLKNNKVTLALYGDGEYTDTLASLAEYNNIETMLTIPLEAYPNRDSYNQLNAIKVNNPLDQNKVWARIHDLHKHLPKAQGLTHYWGDFASSEADFMKIIINYCTKYNLYYIDAMTTSKSKGFELALRNQILSSWALSYEQVLVENLFSYVEKNGNPILMMTCKTSEEMRKIKNIISLIDKNHFKIVTVSELLNTDLPKID